MIWTIEHRYAARAEGWDIFECDGSANGPWQVQRFDDARYHTLTDGSHPPQLNDDDAAWVLVASRVKPHHVAALAFLQANNPQEYDHIVAFASRRVTFIPKTE